MQAADPPDNIHATAIVVENAGLLFVGPSGSGKSSHAFSCLAAADRRGLFCALVADDRVLVRASGGGIVAACPPQIAGRMELRGTGIVAVRHVARAVLHLAVLPDAPGAGARLPDPDERFALGRAGDLPAVHIRADAGETLERIAAMHPEIIPLGGIFG